MDKGQDKWQDREGQGAGQNTEETGRNQGKAAGQGEQDRKDRRNSLVTRRDFYGCIVILLLAIFLQGMQTRALIRRQSEQLQNGYTNQLSGVQGQISAIPNSIELALLTADAPLQNSDMEIASVDMKKKTVVIRMTAMPKEWKEGDTSLQFYLSCDGGEKIAVAAAADADHSFTAEQEIPFCDTVSVSAVLQRGGSEYVSRLGETDLSGAVYPYFNGDFLSSYTWGNGAKEATVSGDIRVDVQPSAFMQKNGLELKNPTIEITVDGKRIQRHTVQPEADDPDWIHYADTIEKGFSVAEGQTVEVFFKAEDADGLHYTYLVDRTHVTKGDIQTGEAVEAVEDMTGAIQDGRLIVE